MVDFVYTFEEGGYVLVDITLSAGLYLEALDM